MLPTKPNLSLVRRIAGVLVPVFALRCREDLGIGDTECLRQFIDWAADVGFALVQILPINETGGDNSPYNAISSMALDYTLLRLSPEALEDLSLEDYDAALKTVDLAALREGPVRYSVVKPLKERLLRAAFARFEAEHLGRDTERARSFKQFTDAHAGWLDDFALFRLLMDEQGGDVCWDRWPAGRQNAKEAWHWFESLPADRQSEWSVRLLYYCYVQWIAFAQWEALKHFAEERGVALMGDIPFGLSYYSADIFSRPDDFALDWSGGAPPEPYFKDDQFTQKWGQNWGIPLYRWGKMRANNFAWWRQRLRGVRDVFHAFRIDHVLGFYRIYSFPWRPERNPEFLPLNADEARARTGGRLPGFKPRDDDSPENRDANKRDGEELLRMVLEASGDTALIGEDLGTVPDYVRPSLNSLGIAGFKIPIWEPDHRTGGLLRPELYDRLSLATFGSHDHEPVVTLWNGWLNAIRAGGNDAGWARNELGRLADFADIPAADREAGFTRDVHLRLLEALFRTNSWIAVAMITDLLGTSERFNVPGTSAESNWSRRMALPVDALRTDPRIVELTGSVRAILERTGRVGKSITDESTKQPD